MPLHGNRIGLVGETILCSRRAVRRCDCETPAAWSRRCSMSRSLVSAAGLVPVMRLAANAGLVRWPMSCYRCRRTRARTTAGKCPRWSPEWSPGAVHRRHGALAACPHGQAVRPARRAVEFGIVTAGVRLRVLSVNSTRSPTWLLVNLAGSTPVMTGSDDDLVLVDVDDTVIDVHGYAKQGAASATPGVQGLNTLLVTQVASADLWGGAG
jgi:hypothetical protein